MRMRRHHYQQEEDTGIDLTPMLDVVFIMLIFFIVTSSFIKESGVEVQRPQDSIARKPSWPSKKSFWLSGSVISGSCSGSFARVRVTSLDSGRTACSTRNTRSASRGSRRWRKAGHCPRRRTWTISG